MKCPKCGTEFSEGVFCPECGTKCDSTAEKKIFKKKEKANVKVSEAPKGKKKNKLPIIIGVIAIIGVACMALGQGGSDSSGGGNSAVSDLGDYLPLGKDEVMKLVSKAGLNEENPGFYTNDDLRITTDEDGLIDTMTLKTSKYNIYGIKVGDEYSFDHFFKVLGDHSYTMMGEDDSQSVWGITSGDQDRVLTFMLYSGKVDTIFFMRHGANDMIAANADDNNGATQEAMDANTSYAETLQSEIQKDNQSQNKGSEIYGVYSQEFGRRIVYAEVGKETDTDYDYLKLLNSPFAENEPEEYSYYQLYTEDGENWYGVDSKCAVFLSEEGALEITIPGEDWTLYKQPEGTQMPSVNLADYSVSDSYQSSKVINPDYMGDPGSYLCSWSDSEYMTEDQLQNLSYQEARILKNEIYARHGRRFNDSSLQDYFDEKSWYDGTISPDDFNEAELNGYEKANILVIESYMTKHAS